VALHRKRGDRHEISLCKGRWIGNHKGVLDASRIMRWEWMPRYAGMYGIWLVVAGWSLSHAAVGIPAAGLAAWSSVVLLPPGGGRVVLRRLPGFALRFLWQSVAAGVDVAWRVFQPRMRLQPGIVRVSLRLPAGPGRSLFRGLASLQPGSLACGVDRNGDLLFHCLDTREDMEGALSRSEMELLKLWEERR
jgi:multicomponent Na+:H+ antiporter subunit E